LYQIWYFIDTVISQKKAAGDIAAGFAGFLFKK
jgi:hypothetical protein